MKFQINNKISKEGEQKIDNLVCWSINILLFWHHVKTRFH